jgi:uncharacterized membrane protein YbhN (UPF0104 family)
LSQQYSPNQPGDTPPSPTPEPDPQPAPVRPPWKVFLSKLSPFLTVLSLGLFALAIWRAYHGFAWSTIFDKNPLWLTMMIVTILLNVVLSTIVVVFIARTFKPTPQVHFLPIARLILASNVLNYAGAFLPVGLFVRAGYLKINHDISLTDSVKITILMLGSAVVACLVLIAAFAVPWGWIPALLALILACAFMRPLWAKFAPDAQTGHPWTWLPIRILEVLGHGVRVWLTFLIVGSPLTPIQAICVGSLTILAGLASGMPSSLGVREWAISLSGAWLGAASGPVGLAAGLIDRACEALVNIAIGGPCLFYLKRNPPTPSQPPK